MFHSEASESSKADSGSTTAQVDTGNMPTTPTTPTTPTGPGSATDTAANSSKNTTISPQQWTTIPFRTAPAIQGRGGSAARSNYNPVNRGINTRGRETWNNGTLGRAPARSITPGYTAAMSSSSWANGPPRDAPAFKTPRSTSQAYRERPGPQYAPTQTTAPDSTGRAWNKYSSAKVPPTAPAYQEFIARPPTDGWKSLNRFVTGQTPTPAPTQTTATEEPSGTPRTQVVAEATMELCHNISTAGAATEPVIEQAAVGESTNKQAKAITDGQSEPSIEIPGNSHSLMNPLKAYEAFMPRKSWNKSGQEANVSINSHRVTSFPDKKIYQYDVLIGNGIEKRGLIRSVWESQAVKFKIGDFFIFDGNRIGWSMHLFENELNFEVDLDKERNIPIKDGRLPNRHRVIIKKTNEVNPSVLKYYLDMGAVFDNSVLEAINFLDHLLRETPSKSQIAVKRSYFSRKKLGSGSDNLGGKNDLTGGIEALKGVYQSIRLAEGGKLVINADVSNATFWKDSALSFLAREIVDARRMEDVPSMIKSIPGGGATGAMRESPRFGALRRLCKNEIKIKHRGCSKSVENKTFRIERIREETARDSSIEITDKVTGSKQMISVENYFARKHNVHLNYPDFPLVEVGRKGALYPMELCHMVYGQRYPYKLDPQQTTNMIRFAVSKPNVRKQAIKEKVALLDWKQDPFLNNYGLRIEPTMLKTKARVLNPPEIMFSLASDQTKVTAKPGIWGKWDLKGRKFLKGNTIPLKSWGVYVYNKHVRVPNNDQVKAFCNGFVTKYRAHGGMIDSPDPVIIWGNQNGAEAVEILFNSCKAHEQYPQLMFFILRGPDSELYSRIKRSADCRYGVVSQCVQPAHVMKYNDQYLSNVCMKVNAKLGGTTSQVKSAIRRGRYFEVPTMIIGADVSHAAPGTDEASLAAMTVSMDEICARYAAAAETNGIRSEMITTKNIEKMLAPLIEHWKRTVGGGKLPGHVYYFRDGVSAGQYQAVLNYEVEAMKQLFAKLAREKYQKPKFTVVIAEKRHHIRFFPDSGDQSGNPHPGTLVERDVTHPFEYDFYLCSHKAIQGTARPTHYHVLKDECEHRGDNFQNMIYEHCYQYMRSTTAVALFPAVYYAHLASNRARSHLKQPETGAGQRKTISAKADANAEPKPLLEMHNAAGIQTSMWYI